MWQQQELLGDVPWLCQCRNHLPWSLGTLPCPRATWEHVVMWLLVGLSSECGGTCILSWLPLLRGEPSSSAELTLNPVGAAGSCGRSRCHQSCSVEGVSNSRCWCTAEKHSWGHRWVWAAQVPK